jgi:PAS domain S-box-containing protein
MHLRRKPGTRTTLRETEARFNLITQSLKDYILILDPHGRIVFINRTPAGVAPERAVGAHFTSGLIPEAGAVARQLFQECIESGRQASYTAPGVRLDGTPGWFEVRLEPVLAEGRVQSVVVLAVDRTEAWAAEEKLRCLTEELEERVRERTGQLEASNKELEDLTYAVAHDLRSPLRGIDGFSEVLLEDYQDRMDERGRHYLRRIRHGAQRMGLLMESLLNLSRLNRGELDPVAVDVSRMSREILDDLARGEPERRVAVSIQPGLRVRADHRMLRVVLENLLGNAWKFSATRAEARIEVGAAAAPDGTGAVCIRDNGVGFDMAFAGKLFGSFQRLHADLDFPGLGMGLAMAQRILHRHGGQAWATAEPDRGAAFFFSLPA